MYPSIRFPGRVLAFAVLAALLPPPAAAQAPVTPFAAKNSVYLEVGGNALLYSVNYERLLIGNLSARVGISTIPGWFPWVDESDDGAGLVMVPVLASVMFGPENHHFEVGAGATFGNASVDIGDLEGSESWVYGSGMIGYRYQRPEGGPVFRATVTPLFIEVLDISVLPMIGLSLGRSF